MQERKRLVQEEQEVLRHIFADDLSLSSAREGALVVRLGDAADAPDSAEAGSPENVPAAALLSFSLPKAYPDAPPVLTVAMPWLEPAQLAFVQDTLVQLHRPGEPVLFDCTVWLKDHVPTLFGLPVRRTVLAPRPAPPSLPVSVPPPCAEAPSVGEEQQVLDESRSAGSGAASRPSGIKITHTEPFVDRKSVFQGHAATVTSLDEVRAVRDELLANGKIARATHNMVVYAISHNGAVVRDADEDGEAGAASKLLALFSLLGCTQMFVMVSRWYGGIQLGPDRFKHIQNTARAALEAHGALAPASASRAKGRPKR